MFSIRCSLLKNLAVVLRLVAGCELSVIGCRLSVLKTSAFDVQHSMFNIRCSLLKNLFVFRLPRCPASSDAGLFLIFKPTSIWP